MPDTARPQTFAEFFVQATLDPRQSAEEGRPIHRDKEMVRIRWAGDRKRELVAPAHEKAILVRGDNGGGSVMISYSERYAREYEAFLRGKQDSVAGTPVDLLPGLTESLIADFKAVKILTIEQLAGVQDRDLPKIGMGSRKWRDAARAFLDHSADTAAVNKISAENEDLRSRLSQMEAMLAEMQGRAVPAPGDRQSSIEDMSDEDLRSFLAECGIPVRANAARDKLLAAAREAMEIAA